MFAVAILASPDAQVWRLLGLSPAEEPELPPRNTAEAEVQSKDLDVVLL